jgi:hypothetical protein
VHDHIIVSKSGHASMKGLKLIEDDEIPRISHLKARRLSRPCSRLLCRTAADLR